MEQELRAWDEARKAKAPGLRDMARTLVEQHPETFAAFAGLSLETCVGMVSGYRAAGRMTECIAADVWCQATFGPQTIIGAGRVGG